MSFEFGTKADYEKGTFQTTWTWWPEDTLEALDLMLVYLGVNDKLVRPQERVLIRRDSRIEATLHRALHDKPLRAAIKLICPGRRCSTQRRALCYYVTPSFDIKGRLAIAGIDVNTCLVNNERRWAFAWQQLSNGNKIIYYSSENEKLFRSDFPTPPIEPVVKHVVTTFTKGSPAKVAFKFQKKNNYTWRDGKRIYEPGYYQEQQKREARRVEEEGPQL